MDALALTPLYEAFLITTDVLGQKFEDLPLEHDILSFIRDLGHSGDIIYLTDVNVDYLHQPWSAFSTFINKCLSGKETGIDNIQKAPKPKYVRKKADHDTSPKQKPFQATKGPRIKSKAKVAKYDKKKQPAKKPKAKGLAVLSEVALTEAEQLKLATKRSKTQFYSSHASGSGDGVDTQSKVLDEQQQKTSGTDEGTGTKPGVPDVPIYESESKKESWGDSEDEDEDDENDSNDISDDTNDDDEETDSDRTKSDRIKIPILDQSTIKYYEGEEEKLDDEEMMNDDEDDEVTKEFYEDVNVNLGNKDTKMTNADQGALEQQNVPQESRFEQVEEDAHLLNLENPSPADNEIASLMETSDRHATAVPKFTSGFTITIPPPPPLFNPLLQQATPTPTPTTSEATTLFPSLPEFAYVFKFNERVTNLEKDLSEIKQVDQYAQALSSIPAIVDRYIDNKLGEAINKAIQAHNFNCREEAQAEKREYIELVDLTVRTIIKEEVNAQLPQILPQAISDVATLVIEKNVIVSLEDVVLTRSSS
ncbi:hypothetical protein Tco_0226825 [Tanacetum coccineum]